VVVIAVGEKVTRFQPGDRVACGSWTGGYADADGRQGIEECAVAGGRHVRSGGHGLAQLRHGVLRIGRGPPSAQRGDKQCLSLEPRAGSVVAAVDLAGYLGLRVIAGVGSDDKAALVRGYGACDVINYRSEDLRERIKATTGGEGVDVCFDNVGGTIFEQMARLMKWGGRLMPVGFTSGQIPSVPH